MKSKKSRVRTAERWAIFCGDVPVLAPMWPAKRDCLRMAKRGHMCYGEKDLVTNGFAIRRVTITWEE